MGIRLALAFPGGAIRLARLAFSARLLARRALDRAAPRRRALLGRRLGRAQSRDRFARHGVRDAEPVAEIFQHAAKLVQHRDHVRPGVDDALEVAPFADQAEGPVARPDQAAADEALEGGPHLAMGLDERLLVTRFDSEANDVECRHLISSEIRLPSSDDTPAGHEVAGRGESAETDGPGSARAQSSA